MSFILEALKKAEQRRQQGQVPDLRSLQSSVAMPERRRALWPYALLGTLLINAALLAFYLKPWQAEPEAPLAAVEEPAPVAELPAESAAPEQPAIAAGEAVAPAPLPTTTEAPAPLPTTAEAPAPVAAAVATEDKGEQAAEAAGPPPDATGEAAAAEKPAAAQEAAEAAIPENEPMVISPAGEEPLSSSRLASLPEAQAEPTAMDFNELPTQVRQSLPPIHLTGHIYSDAPEGRFVSVNGRFMQEGETLQTGIVLDEITPKGAVFRYQGLRFQITVF